MSLVPEWVWGVDVAACQLDIAMVHRDGSYHLNVVRVSKLGSTASRLARLHEETRSFATLNALVFPPLIVYVERPTGKFPNPTLDHATGVARAALYDGLCNQYPYPVDVELVAVSDWKKRLGLGGNADKQAVAAWAAQRGYEGEQDGADALAIASCAALECDFGPGAQRPLSFNA